MPRPVSASPASLLTPSATVPLLIVALFGLPCARTNPCASRLAANAPTASLSPNLPIETVNAPNSKTFCGVPLNIWSHRVEDVGQLLRSCCDECADRYLHR